MKKPETVQHTPGPWKFGGKSSWEIYAPDGESICTVSAAEQWQDGICDVKHERSIAKANARLIAAAPDLLALAERALFALREFEIMPELAGALDAAIAKVESGGAAVAGADVQSETVKLRTDNDGLRFALDSAAAVLRVALAYHAEEFDGPPDQDLNISGADLVDFFSSWRETARTSLATARRLIRETK